MRGSIRYKHSCPNANKCSEKVLEFCDSSFGFVWDWSETDASPEIGISDFLCEECILSLTKKNVTAAETVPRFVPVKSTKCKKISQVPSVPRTVLSAGHV